MDVGATAFNFGGAVPLLPSEPLRFNVDNAVCKTDIWFVPVDRINSVEDVFQ